MEELLRKSIKQRNDAGVWLSRQRLSRMSNGVARRRPDAMAVTGEARNRGDPRWLCKDEEGDGYA